jgi:hypothetical protein
MEAFDKANNARYLLDQANEMSDEMGVWLLIADDYASGKVWLGDGEVNAVIKRISEGMGSWRTALKQELDNL